MTSAVLRFAVAAAAVALATAEPQQSEDLPYKLGQFTLFGSGCPKGSVAVTASKNGTTISAFFSQFAAKTNSEVLTQYKSCNLAVPLDLKPGYTVAFSQVEYRGNVYVPKEDGSYADFSAEYFFAGDQGPTFSRTYTGFDGDIVVSDPVALVKWAPCGGSTNFRVNANINAHKAAPKNRDVQIAIDTSTTKLGGFRFNVDVKKC